MKNLSLLTLLPIALLGVACADQLDDQTSAKGEESALPGTAKDDSFRKPTEHGEIMFNVDAFGDLQEDQLFHVWDFKIAGDEAEITLQTTPITSNLDTVMYLYKREAGDTNWGRYISRNDDFEKNIWSRVVKRVEPAEYRVLVKGFKSSIRGTFKLAATCSGPGCPKVDTEETPLPVDSDLNQACHDRISTGLLAPIMGGDGASIIYETERFGLEGVMRAAAEQYKAYWEDIGFWEDMDFGDGHGLDLEGTFTEDGSLVSVSAGGDEDTITFVYEGKDTLIALYHSEQSPTVDFFCPEDTTTSAPVEAPEEFCFGAWLDVMPHDQDGEGDRNGVTTVSKSNTDSDLDKLVAAAVHAYESTTAIGLDDEITFEGLGFEAASGASQGVIVTLSAEGHPTLTYELGDREFDSLWVFTVSQGGKTRWICDEQ